MKNLSSLFKVYVSQIGLAGCFIYLTVNLYLGNGVLETNQIPLILGFVCVFTSFFYTLKTSGFLGKVIDTATRIRRGDFEARIINLNEEGQLRKLSDAVNNSIDISDAFVRESMLTMKAASEGRYHRKIHPEGMQGAFLNSVNGINKAVDILAEKEKQEAAHKTMIECAVVEISQLVSEASQGDLSKRIDSNKFEGGFKKLVGSLNNLMDAINAPINDSIQVMNALSKGDLTKTVQKEYGGEFGKIKDALNGTTINLKDMVLKIKQATDLVNTASKEISSGSLDLSQRTESQASSLEETAASIESMTSNLRFNANNTREAAEKAKSAEKTALEGGEIVTQVVEAMEKIDRSSKLISEITSSIDEIAFQTNILALNASVEAARAGENGKGFAVVAEEVRSLAARAGASAKEIRGYIDESIGLVNNGVKLAKRSGDVLQRIVGSNQELSEYINTISSTSNAQAGSIQEISQAVNQMDESTQKNAALVQQNSAASQSLSDQAEELSEIMTYFNIKEGVRDASREMYAAVMH